MHKQIKEFSISNHLLIDECLKRSISVMPMSEAGVIKLEYKKHVEFLNVNILSQTSQIAYTACKNKYATKQFLQTADLSVPQGKKFKKDEIDCALAYAREIGGPVVLKPLDAVGGKGVYLNLRTEEEIKTAWNNIGSDFEYLLLEKMFKGKEFRVLATKEKVLGVITRIPANVVGNGKDSINILIDKKNKEIKPRDIYLEECGIPEQIIRIRIDDVVISHLKQNNLTLESIPDAGERVYLRENANVTTGGESIDVTNEVHESIKQIAIKAINSIPGLKYGGVDILTQDEKKDQAKDKYVILEINENPGLALHHFPNRGTARDIAKEIIDLAFPETKKEQE